MTLRPPDNDYSLILAFDSDDPEFARGFEAGRLYEALKAGGSVEEMIHATNSEMALRMCEALEVEEFSAEIVDGEWVEFRAQGPDLVRHISVPASVLLLAQPRIARLPAHSSSPLPSAPGSVPSTAGLQQPNITFPLPHAHAKTPATPSARVGSRSRRNPATHQHAFALSPHPPRPLTSPPMPTVTSTPDRPQGPKPAGPRRTDWLKIRVSPEEKLLIDANATAAGLPTSEFIRRIGLGVIGDGGRGQAAEGKTQRAEAAAKARAALMTS